MPTPANLVHQTSTTTGTGNFTLRAVDGKQSFATAFSTGSTTDVFDYFISHRNAAEWERGTGHMSDSTTLVRDTVIESTNSNAAVVFTAGTKDITNDVPALKQVVTDLTQTLTNKTLTSPVIAQISNTGTLTLPTSTDTLVGRATTDTLTNKTLTSPVLTTPSLGVATATSINGLTITSTTGTLTIANGKTLTASNTLAFTGTDSTSFAFPGSSDTVVTLAATQTLTNKTLTAPTITSANFTAADNLFTLFDDASPTKQAQFQLSGITAGQTRTLTVPDASTTIVGTDATQTLTNKTLVSATLTGTPTAPTATADNNSMQVATTAFVKNQLARDGVYNVLDYGAANDVQFKADGVITNGSLTLTSATATFTGSEGDTIVIDDADVISSGTVTINLGTDVFTLNSHGFQINDRVAFTTDGALPTNVAQHQIFYVRDATTNTFKISASKGGTAVDASGSQSGTHTVRFLRPLKTTIASVNSATSVELAAAPTVTGTSRFIQWGTDSTAGFDAALDACEAAGGGIVWIPDGIYQASTIKAAHRSGITIKGAIWGVNQLITLATYPGIGSVILPTDQTVLFNCVGSVQLRIEDLQIGSSSGAAIGTTAILLANSTTRSADAYELRNVFVNGRWASGALYQYGVTADIRNCRFWNYDGTITSFAAIFTRDNVHSLASTHGGITIETGTTGNPNVSVYDTEFHEFTGLRTPNGAVLIRGGGLLTFTTCLLDASDETKGVIEAYTAGGTDSSFTLNDCAMYSESAGPIVNAFSIYHTGAITLFGVGNQHTAAARAGGGGTLTDYEIGPNYGVVTTAGTQTLTNKTLTSPVLTTPTLGVATGTSLALGGATIGSHALAATGTANISSTVTALGIAFSDTATGGITGTTTNDSAAAGKVGEYQSVSVAVGDAVSLTSTVAKTITSMNLTAGDWDVWGVVVNSNGAGTTINVIESSVSLTPDTLSTLGLSGRHREYGNAANVVFSLPTGVRRISIAGTTQVDLVAFVNFAVNTCAGYGELCARRVR